MSLKSVHFYLKNINYTSIIVIRFVVLASLILPYICADKGDYKGCFSDNNEIRQFSYKSNSASASLSVDRCIEACSHVYFMYAALQDAKYCFCGSHYKNGKPSTNCSKPCVANQTQECGGLTDNSVYETGILTPGPPENLTNTDSNEHSLKLEWKPPLNSNGGVTNYKITPNVIEAPFPTEYGNSYNKDSLTDNNTFSYWINNLHPGSKYNISIQASNEYGDGPPSSQIMWTEVGNPPEPPQAEIISKDERNFTIRLPHINLSTGPLTMFQVIVYDDTVSIPFDPHKLVNASLAKELDIPYYITAELTAQEANKPFVVGDGATYRGYLNKPIPEDKPMTVIIGIVSTLNNKTKTSYSKPAVYQAIFGAKESNLPADKEPDSKSLGKRPRGYVTDGETEINRHKLVHSSSRSDSAVVTGLSIAIGIGVVLLIASIIIYIGMRRYYARNHRSSDHQELTVHQSPITEPHENGIVSNVLCINEDADLMDVYENLKECYWHIPRPYLEIGDRIVGHGKFGPMRLGVAHRHNQQIPVIIQTTPAQTSLTDRERRNLLTELNAMVRLGTHNNVVSFIGASEEKDLFHLATEYYQVSLKDFLLDSRALDHYPVYAEKQKRFSTLREPQLLELATGIARGMSHLSQNKIIHGRLIARHVIILDGTIPKISHFSLSQCDGIKENYDYSRWMSLEALRNKMHTLKSDVWSYGVILWEMCTLGGTPYVMVKSKDVALRVLRGMRLQQTKYISDDLYQLMLQCWQIDMDERPTFSELVNILEKMYLEEQNPACLSFDLHPGFQYEKYDGEQEIQQLARVQ